MIKTPFLTNILLFELEDEFTEIVPSASGLFISHHQGLFVSLKIIFSGFYDIVKIT